MKEIFFKEMATYKVQLGIIIADFLIVIAFLHAFQVYEVYRLDDFYYTVDGGTAGYIDSGGAGIFSYGPYVDLDSGNYETIITYVTDTGASFDIVYKDAEGAIVTIADGALDCSKECVTETFYLEKPVFNQTFEIRTYYAGRGTFQLKEIQLRRRFVINPYMWVSLAVALGSVIIFCGHRILSMFEDSKAVLYWGGFYTMLLCIGIYAMVYSQGQSGVTVYVMVDLLIILHAYGGKRKIYCECFNQQMLINVLCYVYLVFSFFILELFMRNLVAGSWDIKYDTDIPNIFSFSIIGAIVLLISLIPKTYVRVIVYGVVYYVFVLLLLVHTVYFQVFGKLFGFQDLLLAKEGSDYIDYIIGFFDAEFLMLLLGLLAAGIVGILFIRKTAMGRKEWSLWVGATVLSAILYCHTFFQEDYGGWDSFANDSYIYATMNNRQRAFELCGFYQYELKDLKKFLFRHRRADQSQKQKITEYFNRRAEEEGQGQNAMTGLLQGKNMVFVLMESISDIACNDEVMPNLSRMSREGIYFSNMYAPIYGTAATMNAELVTNVGLYAPLDGSMVYSFADNYFPHSLAARFTEHGYTAKQYHYNVAEFYDRNLLNSAFGYKEYVSFLDYAGAECTLDPVLAENEKIYQKLTQNEKYFDYIITYSAHLGYDDTGENVQYALEKYPQYIGMTDSNEIDHYFAKARITDDMLGELVQRLQADGLLENTVIVAIGDHFPYGIADKNALYQLSGVDSYEQLLYKVPCVLWTPGMESIEINKITASNDLVPTLVNLMGFGDCSMYVGNDIFDENYEGYVYCADGSWISGNCYYHDGKLVYGSLEQEKIDEMNSKVMDSITVNDLILQTDYYAD